jgi:hypothetical protein
MRNTAGTLRRRRCVDASEVERLEALAVHRGCAGHVGARGRGSIQAQLVAHPLERRLEMLRRIVLTFGALAVLALAVGAGFKPA